MAAAGVPPGDPGQDHDDGAGEESRVFLRKGGRPSWTFERDHDLLAEMLSQPHIVGARYGKSEEDYGVLLARMQGPPFNVKMTNWMCLRRHAQDVVHAVVSKAYVRPRHVADEDWNGFSDMAQELSTAWAKREMGPRVKKKRELPEEPPAPPPAQEPAVDGTGAPMPKKAFTGSRQTVVKRRQAAQAAAVAAAAPIAAAVASILNEARKRGTEFEDWTAAGRRRDREGREKEVETGRRPRARCTGADECECNVTRDELEAEGLKLSDSCPNPRCAHPRFAHARG
eukprot:TRINITY_DN34604_c0_g1_i1.p2 TRINITY_DN34604_c0_g1~~TRINITY_DN34604_c0_g1_i1.p2  ORF type:complete len:284 (-),score=24.34 TRINITY_DN34604_c0_g1_i1:542-1393(-)